MWLKLLYFKLDVTLKRVQGDRRCFDKLNMTVNVIQNGALAE